MSFERILAILRIAVHSMFVVLTGLGLILAPTGFTWLAVLLLAAVYAANRFMPANLWLALIVIGWLGLLVCSPTFLWAMFPLLFLILDRLGKWGTPATFMLLGAALLITKQWFLGPLIGTVVAIGMYHTYRAMLQQTLHHRAVAAELRATQAALAASEREAGTLEERARVSREIHDTVAQSLSSIVLLARAQNLDLIESQASSALEQTRRIVRDLAETEPLPAALRRVVEEHRVRAEALGEDLNVQLELVGHVERALPQDTSKALLRTAQEGLANVVKHSGATKVVCTLAVWETLACLDVVDNGKGFAAARGVDGGFGLAGLRQRVEALGGTLTVEDNGGGTALSCHIPF